MEPICIRQNKEVTTISLLGQHDSEGGDNRLLHLNISNFSPIDASLISVKNNDRLHCCEKLKSRKATHCFRYDLIYDTLRSSRIYCKWKLLLSSLIFPLLCSSRQMWIFCMQKVLVNRLSSIKFTNQMYWYKYQLIFFTLRWYLSVNTFTFNTAVQISGLIIWFAQVLCIVEMSLHNYINN